MSTSENPGDHELGRIELTVAEGVAVMTMNRPPVNALSSHMYSELSRVAMQIADDESIRVAILTGAGTRFCGGADVKELRTHTPEQRKAFWAVTAEARRRILEMPIPIIAAIGGSAAGAGVAYASYCDYRIASVGASLSMPEINVGSVAGGGEALFALGMPHGAIRHLLFSGAPISSDEALRVHLVDEVASSALDRAHERASAIAEKPREALIAMKRAINLVSAATTLTGEDVEKTQQLTLQMLADRP